MILNIINEVFSVCKVADYEGIDLSSPYIFIGSTDEEKSLVCPIQLVPDNTVERAIGLLQSTAWQSWPCHHSEWKSYK